MTSRFLISGIDEPPRPMNTARRGERNRGFNERGGLPHPGPVATAGEASSRCAGSPARRRFQTCGDETSVEFVRDETNVGLNVDGRLMRDFDARSVRQSPHSRCSDPGSVKLNDLAVVCPRRGLFSEFRSVDGVAHRRRPPPVEARMHHDPNPQRNDLNLRRKTELTGRIDDSAVVLPDGAGSVEEQEDDVDRLLHTPAQAARILAVRESWLRRMASRQNIPCTFVGKHLRFSGADLRAIVQRGSRPARQPSGHAHVRSFRRQCR
ncbi:helix-turn-helix domain-containing protein [Saccharothrix syringae]